MSESWFIWDPYTVLGMYFCSMVIYFVVRYSKEFPEKHRNNAFLYGLATCFFPP